MHQVGQERGAAELIGAAAEILRHAHVPYSGFPVAAAVVDEIGRVFVGVNVENASYGLTNCAERSAIFAAVSAGARRITAIAVTAPKMKPVTPCGACRQVMAEFCDAGVPVYLDAGDACVHTTVGELLPMAFLQSDLQHT